MRSIFTTISGLILSVTIALSQPIEIRRGAGAGGQATNAIGNLDGRGTNTMLFGNTTIFGPLYIGDATITNLTALNFNPDTFINRSNGFGTNTTFMGAIVFKGNSEYFHETNAWASDVYVNMATNAFKTIIVTNDFTLRATNFGSIGGRVIAIRFIPINYGTNYTVTLDSNIKRYGSNFNTHSIELNSNKIGILSLSSWGNHISNLAAAYKGENIPQTGGGGGSGFASNAIANINGFGTNTTFYSGIVMTEDTASRAVVLDANKRLTNSSLTSAGIEYLANSDQFLGGVMRNGLKGTNFVLYGINMPNVTPTRVTAYDSAGNLTNLLITVDEGNALQNIDGNVQSLINLKTDLSAYQGGTNEIYNYIKGPWTNHTDPTAINMAMPRHIINVTSGNHAPTFFNTNNGNRVTIIYRTTTAQSWTFSGVDFMGDPPPSTFGGTTNIFSFFCAGTDNRLYGVYDGLRTINDTNKIYVKIGGSDITGQRSKFDRPFATVTGAVAVAQSGDAIVIGRGTFEVATRVNMPDNIYMIGEGAGVSIIRGSGFLATEGQGPVVNPGDNNVISGLSIISTNDSVTGGFAAPIGANVASHHPFTNVLVRECLLYGSSDTLYIDTNAVCSIRFQNCILQAEFDNVYCNLNSGHLVEIHNSVIESKSFNVNLYIGPGDNNVRRCINNYQGTVKIVNCSLTSENANSYGCAILSGGANAITEAYNSRLTATTTNVAGVAAVTNFGGLVLLRECSGFNVADLTSSAGTTLVSNIWPTVTAGSGASIATTYTRGVPNYEVTATGEGGSGWTSSQTNVTTYASNTTHAPLTIQPLTGSTNYAFRVLGTNGSISSTAGIGASSNVTQLLVPLGLNGTPSISFFGDQDTGLYDREDFVMFSSAGAPQLGIGAYLLQLDSAAKLAWASGAPYDTATDAFISLSTSRTLQVSSNLIVLKDLTVSGVGTFSGYVQAVNFLVPAGNYINYTDRGYIEFTANGVVKLTDNSSGKATLEIGSINIASNILYESFTGAAFSQATNWVPNFRYAEVDIFTNAMTTQIYIPHSTNWPASGKKFTAWNIYTGHTNRNLQIAPAGLRYMYGTNFNGTNVAVSEVVLPSNHLCRIVFMAVTNAENRVRMTYPIFTGGW